MKIESEDTSNQVECKGVTGIPGRRPAVAHSEIRQSAARLQTIVDALRAGTMMKADRLRLSAEMVDLHEDILTRPAHDEGDFEIKLRHAIDGASGLEAPPGTAEGLVTDFRRLRATLITVGH